MKRRKAIQSLSAALGYTLTPGTVTGLLLSCEAKKSEPFWEPMFFEQKDANLVAQLGEAFLPRTQTPGAKDVGAHIFVDVFMGKVSGSEDQELFRKGVKALRSKFEKITQKPIIDGGTMDYSKVLHTLYGVPKDKQPTITQLLDGGVPEGKEEKENFYTYSFLRIFKKILMMGYYASKEIGENVLSYLPVPGDYEGCIPVESVGRAWSIT
ncbi:gluconate 2-dehydrogenase subunit 3 family protein [Ulvibacterium sp.]|uniref:gluconate 2-dehydrogenase subunit 3 family protein n=1 Tax=Ulvibacterium sp. TaxID=2665914 RepID=UPI00262473A3|nr:gluconate 2-dehydrogenase subunit 3 family protein [Ulvibacterium sp.]